jgi:hypothetical protein
MAKNAADTPLDEDPERSLCVDLCSICWCRPEDVPASFPPLSSSSNRNANAVHLQDVIDSLVDGHQFRYEPSLRRYLIPKVCAHLYSLQDAQDDPQNVKDEAYSGNITPRRATNTLILLLGREAADCFKPFADPDRQAPWFVNLLHRFMCIAVLKLRILYGARSRAQRTLAQQEKVANWERLLPRAALSLIETLNDHTPVPPHLHHPLCKVLGMMPFFEDMIIEVKDGFWRITLVLVSGGLWTIHSKPQERGDYGEEYYSV